MVMEIECPVFGHSLYLNNVQHTYTIDTILFACSDAKLIQNKMFAGFKKIVHIGLIVSV
jgi:hypothetical protein